MLVERHSKKKWLLRYLLSNPNHASFITIILNSTNTLQGELRICNYAAERIASAAAKGLKQFTIIRKEPQHLPQPPDYHGAAKVAADANVTSVLRRCFIFILTGLQHFPS